MFRDESSKVIQKAHAQWGTPGSPQGSADGDQKSPTISEKATASTTTTLPLNHRPSPTSSSAISSRSPSAMHKIAEPKLPPKIEPNLDQRGLKFYMERYLLNHPDSPGDPELREVYFSNEEAMRNVMVAVGLAGMSNLLGNKSMNLVARSKYVAALKQTGQLITSVSRDYLTVVKPLRSIVTLALFEVVQGRGSCISASSANTHVHGAVALLRTVLPLSNSPNGGARGALQLMFSMFIPCQMTNTPLPPGYFECLKLCKHLLHDTPQSCDVVLAASVASLLELFITVDRTTFIDDRPETDALIRQFLSMEAVFDRIEQQLHTAHPFVEHDSGQPSAALFRGKWHRYVDIWGARIWNHYRWARLMLGGRIIKSMAEYPRSSARCVAPPYKVRCFSIVETMAEDTLTSTSAHWRHPMLDDATAIKYEAPGQGGAGAAGLPTLLWHLNIAGCAPNVPPELWQWAYNNLQVVWKSMGMQHALALSELMEEHRKTLHIGI
ncbi:hypothetical protein GGR50DRAFT_692012 [Xylaria sp. CBS 124048]|nr:hypothetical protein GGR50DRAFT_692012 [Xylaria sp. CBS 124048]